MNDIHQAALAHLAEQGIAARQDAGEASISFDVESYGSTFVVRCLAPDNADRLLVYAHYPNHIEPIDTPPLEELLTRVNARLGIGNFELDIDRATVRYKTSIDFAGTEPSAAMVGRAIDTCVAMMVEFMPSIASVVNGLPVELAMPSDERELA
jgi:hypothetical protein